MESERKSEIKVGITSSREIILSLDIKGVGLPSSKVRVSKSNSYCLESIMFFDLENSSISESVIVSTFSIKGEIGRASCRERV